MLSVDNVAKIFGDQVLFRNASFAVGAGERIGVVGPNGAGKTTFFRMLAGELPADEGEIRSPKNYSVVQLRQEWLPREGDTVLEAALREFAPWFEARAGMDRIERQLSESPDEKLVGRYQEIEHRFSMLGGHQVEQTARELLAGLGFGPGQFGEPAVQLSGGWRIRCHLAGLLLQEADLLLLDEPTNHLDIRSVKWFEEFLGQYRQSFMLISHDRRLVQRLARSILEFAPPQLTLWPGSLRQYETLKQQRIDQLEATIANRQKEVERLEDFARRFRAKATKARQAQNRLKTADRYQEQIEELQQSMPVISRRPASFRLELERRLPSRVLEFEKAVFGYRADRPLFELPRCVIEGGRKIGIVGVNGAGKSTFLKCCAGELPLLSGSRQRSDQVPTGFFAQHRMEELPLPSVALDYLAEQSFGNPPVQVRSLAASLGLSSRDLEKRIEVLSGGEKARVSLARILLSRPRHAAARRADEPPRPRSLRRPQARAGHLRGDLADRFPQPRLPRFSRRLHSRDPAGRGGPPSRQLQRVARAPRSPGAGWAPDGGSAEEAGGEGEEDGGEEKARGRAAAAALEPPQEDPERGVRGGGETQKMHRGTRRSRPQAVPA